MPRDGGAASGEPRYRFTVAPRFACPARWEERLAAYAGPGGAGGSFEPAGPFEPLGGETLADLVAETPPGADAVLPPTLLGLLEVPERLRRLFWSEAGRRRGKALDRLFAELDAYLRFKRLPLPPRVAFEVCVSTAGLAATGRGTAAPGPRLPLGLVNLGDEESYVVLLAVPPAVLAARLAARGEAPPDDPDPVARAAQLFARFPDEPLLRLRLEPGEGLWLSPFGVVHAGHTQGKRDLDVVLRIGGEASPDGTSAGAQAAFLEDRS